MVEPIKNDERRPLRLEGRYMLPDRAEFPCCTTEVSPGSLVLAADACPYRGQKVVAYLEQIGRVEGVVVRLERDNFTLRIEATERKREQLANALARLLDGDVPASWQERAHAQPDRSGARRPLSAAYVAAVAESLDLNCPVEQDAEADEPKLKAKPPARPDLPFDPVRRYLDHI